MMVGPNQRFCSPIALMGPSEIVSFLDAFSPSLVRRIYEKVL
jgi:hypothetical protein